MALHAELHRHLGGAVVPRVLWRYLMRNAHPLASRFPIYEDFETFYTSPRRSLGEYLELHTLVESVQTRDTLTYFVSKLLRGAYVFEGICYLELRYTPYFRTDRNLRDHERLSDMRDVIQLVASAAEQPEYPVIMKQILCLHSQLPFEVNSAMLDLAIDLPDVVCGIDLAGPDTLYSERMDEWITLFGRAKAEGIKTTGHLYETPAGCDPRLLPYLDRIGHGIQIPLIFPELLPDLARRRQCLEVCPTTYLKTGTLSSLNDLQTVFRRCEEQGVDTVICTDNAGMHNVRLPWEFENLLTLDIIDFGVLKRCQDAAFRHAFAWPGGAKTPTAMLGELIGLAQ